MALTIVAAVAGAATGSQPEAPEIERRTALDCGLALVLDTGAVMACDLARSGRWLVHLLVPGEERVATAQELVTGRGLGGRVVVASLQPEGKLPHPDRFANLVMADLDGLGSMAPEASEIERALAVRGASFVRKDGTWQATPKRSEPDLDGWFAHWYDAAGNCVSRDRIAGFPRSVQWQHGPAMEDGTADGKIPRIADGRLVLLDNHSGDLICRDAANGLLLWRRAIGSRQNSDVSLAAGRVHLWYDPEREPEERDRRKETGPLSALDLETGQVAQVYDQGLRAGTVDAIEVAWGGRTRRVDPVPWFVVNDEVLVQAYGGDLVVLDRGSGERHWKRSIEGATWFSPVVSGDSVLAAEAVEPARRQRNNGSDHVRAVVCFSIEDGSLLWRNEEVHAEREFRDRDEKPFLSRSSFKTMSVSGRLVLLHVSSYQFRTGGSIAVLDLSDGRELWRRQFDPKELYTQGSQRPVLRDGEVVLLDGTGVYRFDAKTGEPIGEPVRRPRDLERTGRSNGACTGSRATVNWLMANAWLYVGPEGKPQVNPAARGACGQGVVPAHGLVYVPPTACDCGDYVRGLLALSPEIPGSPVRDAGRLTRGGPPLTGKSGGGHPWPVFLGNSRRTSSTGVRLESPLRNLWSVKAVERRDDDLERDRRESERYLGSLSAPVVARDLVVMAAPERHGVLALDGDSGRCRWRFLAGGKVDSPPTLWEDKALFGCDDGQVYAVRLEDGKLLWRFRAAPTNGVSMSHGHISSAFPIPGSVLVLGGRVIAIAGNHTDLGGLHCWVLDVDSGEPQAYRVLASDGAPALSNNLTVADPDGKGFWVASLPGGSYGGGGAYHLSLELEDLPRGEDTEGPAMVFDRQGTRIRFRTDRGRGGSTHGWKGAMRAGGFRRLYGHRVTVTEDAGFALEDPTSRSRRAVWATRDRGRNPEMLWELAPSDLGDIESLGALAAAADCLVVGGGARDGSSGRLFLIDRTTGSVEQTIELPARVTECGLAIADRLYVTCEDGTVACFE